MQLSRPAFAANEKRNLLVRLARVVFRPAVQLLLRHGISGLEIEEIVRWCCVDVALNEPEFAIPGRNVHSQTQSHAAILTGFTRSEVKRLAEHPEPEVDAVTERASRIERVIEVWRTGAVFHDEQGQPLSLPLRGPAPSLEAIVRREGRDTPVRAIADTLVVAGNAEWEGRRLKLKREKQTFTGLSHSPENVVVITQIAGDFMHTLQECFQPQLIPQPRLREAFYWDIDSKRLDVARAALYREISEFNSRCRFLLEGYRAKGEAPTVRLGVGSYSFLGGPRILQY